MKSITACCTCPKCGQTTKNYHGTYMRKVQDLPILGKNVQLETTAHEYNCMNKECNTTSISETFDGFLNAYSRMTERCAVFVYWHWKQVVKDVLAYVKHLELRLVVIRLFDFF